ncbi:elongation factor P maturation arginine rhamnosyltransferase EarP [Chromobacterium haemolyticum]|nr:elongation factor P maturation arginine rhamnosyltransferase EarP [Chromobacterium haemolyticum]
MDQSGIPVGGRLDAWLPPPTLSPPALAADQALLFPGFGADTGGLICEQGLLDVRRQWQDDTRCARRAYWQLLELPEPAADEWRVSLFAYENPAITSLLAAWALGERRVTCLLPEGKALPDAARVFGYPLRAGMLARQGSLTVKVLPMTDQDSYDLLLWSCDLNLVRGEDSFVRAQWAGRPFLWHIYPQDDDAHLAKLDAFLSQYGARAARRSGASADRSQPCLEPRCRYGRRMDGIGRMAARMARTRRHLAGKIAGGR